MAPLSPDTETFSTPPTTPFASSQPIPAKDSLAPQHPGLTRKNSRPHFITIDRREEGQPLVQVEQEIGVQPSPGRPTGTAKHTAGQQPTPSPIMQQYSASPAIPSRLRPSDASSPGNAAYLSQPSPLKQSYLGPQSPCFVHSHLDKGASLTDWLRNGGGRGINLNMRAMEGPKDFKTNAPSSQSSQTESTSSPTSSNSLGFIPSPSDYDDEDEDDGVGSLTRQLAATAVGVREMSKQLGRARVRSNIQNVMIITKARDNRLIKLTRDLALYLMMKRGENGRGLVVYVDSQLRTSKRFDAAGIQRDYPELFRPTPRRRSSSSYSVPSDIPTSPGGNNSSNGGSNMPGDDGQLRYWTSDMCSKSPHLFDFVVTLGGDGTVLFTSWLFQRIVPPVLPFALGSLGFLTPFDFADYKEVMDTAIDSGIRVNLRMRFTCTVYRAVASEKGSRRKAVKRGETGEILMKNIEKGGWEALEGGYTGPGGMPTGTSKCKDKEIMCFTTRPVESFEVINDLVVDRGPSPYVSLLELFGDEHHMTTVQADGLTVSTPTGSTAYSLSAGGSLVHPEIPAILITPICPHTLSFRPMLLPDTMELRICVPFNSRSTAWASFDGRGRVELKQGDHIKVTASQYPFPTVCADKQSTDWFHAIARTLKWNERERQKSFVVVEEGPEKPRPRKARSSQQPSGTSLPEEGETNPEDDEELEDDDEEDDEEEEEEKFDIDDSSPEAAAAKAAATTSIAEAAANMKANNYTPEESNAKPAELPRVGKRGSTSESGGDSEALSQKSGITTPGRFRVDLPHPPKVHARHMVNGQDGLNSYYAQDSPSRLRNETDLGSPRVESLPSESDSTLSSHTTLSSPSIRTPRFDSGASLRTPRAVDSGSLHHQLMSPAFNASLRRPGGLSAPNTPRNNSHHRRGKSYGDVPVPSRRAFAVYGQDESDSNASD